MLELESTKSPTAGDKWGQIAKLIMYAKLKHHSYLDSHLQRMKSGAIRKEGVSCNSSST